MRMAASSLSVSPSAGPRRLESSASSCAPLAIVVSSAIIARISGMSKYPSPASQKTDTPSACRISAANVAAPRATRSSTAMSR